MGALVKEISPIKSITSIFTGLSLEDIVIQKLRLGESTFTYKGYIVHLTYDKNNYLRISCQDEALLNIIIPIGTKIMDSYIIAFYQMDNDSYSELLPTAEWNNSDPDERIDELRRNDPKQLGFRCHNLELYDRSTAEGRIKRRKNGLF